MNKLLLTAVGVNLLASSLAFAQLPPTLDWRAPTVPAPTAPPADESPEAPSAQIDQSVPPHAWLYLQEQKRWDDPKLAVRRKAEFRAAQRQKRMASSRWFGYSVQRPVASTTPIMDFYSPFWSGNSNHPFIWIGQGWPTTALHLERVVEYR